MSDTLKKPLITEKVVKIQEKSGNTQYAFLVDINANKIQIKNAIEQQFDVEVSSIRTMITAPRRRRRYTKTGLILGQTNRTKKAFVTLATAVDIDFYKTN